MRSRISNFRRASPVKGAGEKRREEPRSPVTILLIITDNAPLELGAGAAREAMMVGLGCKPTMYKREAMTVGIESLQKYKAMTVTCKL